MDYRGPVTAIKDLRQQGTVHRGGASALRRPILAAVLACGVRGIYADGDTVVVLWDGEGIRLDGKPYENTYAWFMRFHEGLVVEATAFYDSIAFNEL